MRRLFILVAAVVFVDMCFYAAISPLLPHYTDELHLSKAAAGILSASYAAGTLLAALPSGWLAARVGVKPTVLTGLGLLAASSLVFGLAHDVVVLDLARFAQGVGGACSWAGGMAWLVAATPSDRRGQLIGSVLGAAIVGVLLGPVLGGAATVASPEAVFSCVAAVAAGLALWALTMPGVPRSPTPPWSALTAALGQRSIRTGIWLMTLPALFTGVLNVLGPLRLSDLGASGVAVGAVWLIAAALEAALSPVVGRVSDRRGRLAPIKWGIAAACVMCVLLPLPNETLLLAPFIVAAFLTLTLFWAPAMAFLSDAAESAGLDQGLGFALTNLAWAAGQVVGGSAGAKLGESVGDAFPYALCAALCAATLLWFQARGGRAAEAVA